MSNDLKLQIVVNDEIIDLRNENLQKDIMISSATSRCSTQQKHLKGMRKLEEIHGAGLRKLANQLYVNNKGGTSSNLSKNKIKLRAASADPRFRRERSPTRSVAEKKVLLCKSELHTPHLIKTSTVHTKSEPTLETFDSKECTKNESVRDSQIKLEDLTQSNQSHYEAPATHLQIEEKRNKETKFKGDVKHKEEAKYKEEVKFKVEEKNKEEEINKDDEPTNLSHVTTEADFPTPKSASIKDLQKEWNDSKMHSDFLKNARISSGKPAKSTWTLPVYDKVHSKYESSCCRKKQEKNTTANTYKFDAYTEEETSEYDKSQRYKWIERIIINCLFTPFFMLGCILGLVLVATVIWLFAGDYFWNLLANQQKEVKCTKLQAFVTYVAGSMIYGINSTFQKLFSLLSLQRNAVMAKKVEEPPENWFFLFNR